MIDPIAECAQFGARQDANSAAAFALPKNSMILIGKQLGAPLGDYARRTSAEVALLVVKRAKEAAGSDWLPHMQQAAREVGEGRAAPAMPPATQQIVEAQPEAPVPTVPPQVDEHFDKHPLFSKVLALTRVGDAHAVNVLLVGPAGCGKTTLAAQLATHLGLPLGVLSMSAGVSESALTGWLLPTGDAGRFEYHPAPFVEMCEKEAVFLFDEFDAADPNLALQANTAFANRYINIPHRLQGARVDVHPGTILLAAANTWGQGADAQYVGRNQLDAATLDRFYMLAMDYDASYEYRIAGLPAPVRTAWRAGAPASQAVRAAYAQWVFALRAKVANLGLRRVVSTRMLQKGLHALQAGVPLAEVKIDMLAGWSKDELSKVADGAPERATRRFGNDQGDRF
jgi:MoxR-like ATPase